MGIAKEVRPGLRLTALHLVGFKSFADKIELRFGPGVTAIVGPNGSGKSNVVDAVRWVLGEQNSRLLRSERVTNLIFAGTERRQPLGLAQATLVLDNSAQTAPVEYTELNVVRRVYRSGESEFFLNGTPCRLRDIQHLLLGTGLGRAGMAVVGQGEIDAILSARPLDRRLLLEETAGTSRYRAQQQTATRRLERARQDLSRVRDLIVELSARAEGLSRQAEAAARYRQITAALRRQRARRAAEEWRRARRRRQEAVARLGEERRRLEALEKERQKLQAEEARAEARVTRDAEALEAARAELGRREAARADAGHRRQLLQLQLEAAEGRLRQAAEEQQRRGEEEARAKDAFERLEGQIAAATAAVADARGGWARAEEELTDTEARRKQHVGRRDRLRDELAKRLQQTDRQRDELARLEAEAAREAEAAAERQKVRDDLRRRWTEAKERRDEAKKLAAAGAARLEEGRREDGRLADELKRAREGQAAADRRCEEARRGLQEAEANRRALERLEASFAGYRPAVKAVLGARPPLQGILGTVGQLLDVPEKLEAPIQAALGAATQFIVAADDRAVSAAIARLRRERSGRATFLSLESIRPRPWPADGDGLLRQEGVVGRAAALVRFDPFLAAVVQYLLGRVVIVEGLSRAQTLARSVAASLRLVTMEGDLLTPGGPVTGGFQRDRRGDATLSRRRELRRLTEQTELWRRRLEEAEGVAAAARAAVEDVEARVKARRSATTEDAIEQARQHQYALQAEAEMDHLEGALQRLDREGTVAAERAEAFAGRRAELERALVDGEKAEGDLRARLAEADAAAADAEEALRTASEKAAEARARRAAREEALKGLMRRRDEARHVVARAAAERQRFAALQRQAQFEAGELQKEMDDMDGRTPELEGREAAAREAAAAALARRDEGRAELEGLRQARARAAAAVEATKERVWAAETAAARHESAVEGHARRLRELDVDDEAAAHMAGDEQDPPVDVAALERELEKLGPVHLGAEEELREVQSRLDFLQEQERDLEQAGASLEEVIQRLDDISSRRFEQTLQQVGGAFDDIFRRLFGGGRGRLVPSEGPEEGVDVHVQMPGKRTQNLLALSGGERALTAIALLFALLQVQPSPFYVLDEIDSALDEANLGRFQQLLREASREAQFIVVTHRATTMEVADTLYGVTAAEPGVSTVISLDLQGAMATIA